MQRYQLRTVTDIPVLIPCEAGKPCDGLANFYAHLLFEEVRIVKPEELKNLRTSLKPDEARFLADCLALRVAANKRDQLALEGPYERLWPFITGQANWPSPVKVIQIDPDFHLGWPDPGVAKAFASGASGELSWIHVFLPQLVTNALRDVKLVLWWFKKQQKFIPAIFCPDLKTALFLKGLLGEIRICPRCNKPFVPLNANIDYCSPAHREAHRVARWRAQKKLEASTAKRAAKKPRR